MIIKSKPLSPFLFKCLAVIVNVFFKRRFNKMIINGAAIKPNHSYILMCNHFGFLDGLLAFYLCNKVFYKEDGMRRLYIMSLKKQMEKNNWLRYIGSFSVEPGKRSIQESFDYAAEMLSQPGNLLLFYPQGQLESSHVRHIKFDEGIYEIVTRIKGDCQLIWSSNLIEYFESIKPSAYFNLLDCGTNNGFDFEALKEKVNAHHLKSIQRNIRYTQEPG
jgi:1-acyl-sn-glycerol-3-phosphate acyltransferase